MHRVRNYLHRPDQVPIATPVSIASTVQSPRAMSQPFRGRGTGRGSIVLSRGSTAFGRDRGALDRGVTQTEAR